MKILHISAQKPDSTGSGVYLSGIVRGLQENNTQSLVCGIDIEDSVTNICEKFENKVSVYPVIYNSEELDFNVPGMSDNMPYPSTRYRDMTDDMAEKMKNSIKRVVKEAVEDLDPDVIVCHHLYYITSIVREMYPNRKIVSICHGTCLRQLHTNDFKKTYIIENISKLDKIFSLHEKQAEDIVEMFSIPKEKVCVLGSGYDDSIFNINKTIQVEKYESKKIRISYAGKLSYSKGLIPFIEALDGLPYSSDEVEVVFAGDGSIESEKNHIIDKGENCKFSIDFLGRIDQYRLAEELNKSDIFVLPSYYEGLPLVILEAMSCGNYVITSNVDGVSTWLGDEVNNSGLIDYVRLPEMESVSVPKESEVKGYKNRLIESLVKAIDYRKNNRTTSYDISYLSWNGLAKKLYNNL